MRTCTSILNSLLTILHTKRKENQKPVRPGLLNEETARMRKNVHLCAQNFNFFHVACKGTTFKHSPAGRFSCPRFYADISRSVSEMHTYIRYVRLTFVYAQPFYLFSPFQPSRWVGCSMLARGQETI